MQLSDNLNVSMETLQEMQKCQLKILKELKSVCYANGIKYYLAFGTALGAVRHKGFIPWDDDIDLYMSIGDVEKLVKLQNQLPSNLFVQTRETDTEYGLLIARIRDSNTTLIEEDHVDRDINHGVYIDIYPQFFCPENNLKMKWMVILSFFCRLFAYNAPPMNKGVISTSVAKMLLTILTNKTKKRMADYLYHYITSQSESKYVSNFPEISEGKRYLAEWFQKQSFCEFEGEVMPMPLKMHEYLSYEYGDYMQLPPEEKRQIHHNYLFTDLENSYIKYKGVKYFSNKNV